MTLTLNAMPNDKVTQWKKWTLVIDNVQLTVPTKEHGERLGKYLRSFGVPVAFNETTLSVSKDNGNVKVVDKTTTDISYLLEKIT